MKSHKQLASQIRESSDALAMRLLRSFRPKSQVAEHRLFGGNTYHIYDNSTHLGSSAKDNSLNNGGEKKYSNQRSDSVVSKILFFCGIVIMLQACAYAIWRLLSAKIGHFHDFSTYYNRWQRKTQLVQSAFELTFTLATALTFFKLGNVLITIVALLSGVSQATIAASFILLAFASLFQLSIFLLGFVLGNVAVVSLIRWWAPLGTGRGRQRLHSDFLECDVPKDFGTTDCIFSQQLKQLKDTQELVEVCQDNLIDSLRYLKKLIKIATKESSFVTKKLDQFNLYELNSSTQVLVEALKKGIGNGSDQRKMQGALRQVKHLSNLFLQSIPDVSNNDHKDFSFLLNLALTQIESKISQSMKSVCGDCCCHGYR